MAEYLTHMVDVDAKRLTAKRLEYVVYDGLFQKAEAEELDMREVVHQLQADAHETGERNIFQEYRHGCCGETLSETYRKNDFWVHFVGRLFGCHIRDIIGSEGETPVHHNDVFCRCRECPHFVDSRSFRAKSECRQTKRLQEGRGVCAEDLID